MSSYEEQSQAQQRQEQQRQEQQRQESQRQEVQRQMARDGSAQQDNARLQHSLAFKKEYGNRCANNDGPAVVGSLCAGCYAAAQAAEGSAGRARIPAPGETWPAFLDRLPIQVHHFASDKGATEKSSHRIQMMEEIIHKYQLELDGDQLELEKNWNKEALRHRGPHPDAYHDFVLGTLQFIDEECRGDRERFLAMYQELVKATVIENPEMLRKAAWYE